MNRIQLETYADAVEGVLKRHKISTRIVGGTIFPFSIHFSTGGFVPDDNRVLVQDLENCLGMTIRIQGGSIVAEKPIDVLQVIAKIKDIIPPKTATLGICDDGAPLLIRLPSPSVGDILITGPDRAANTSLLRTIAISLAMRNSSSELGLLLIGDGLSDLFSSLPHCKRFAIAPYLVVIVDDPENTSLRGSVQDRGACLIVSSTRSISSTGYGTLIRPIGEPDHFEAINSGQSVAFRAAQYHLTFQGDHHVQH